MVTEGAPTTVYHVNHAPRVVQHTPWTDSETLLSALGGIPHEVWAQ